MCKCDKMGSLTFISLSHNPNHDKKKPFENIVRKGENACNQHFLLFIRLSKTGRIIGSPVASEQVGSLPSRRRPVLCLEHISKTLLAMVMKFCGWIDLIKGECSVHDP